MIRLALLASGLSLAAASAGCLGPPIGEHPLAVGPLDEFEAQVQPLLEQECAQGGCHGRPDRPFVLYAAGAYRADPERTHLSEPLSFEETEMNAWRLAALAVPDDPRSSLSLLKPLAIEGGGIHHGGGDVFPDPDDPRYQVLLHWLEQCVPAGAP